MSKQEEDKRKELEWEEVEEYIEEKDQQLINKFGFDVRVNWYKNKKLSREELKRRRRRLQTVEFSLKVMLIVSASGLLWRMGWYIVRLYTFGILS